jgi:hypothetical protein
MKVEQLIELAERRIAYLERSRAAALSIGDVDSVVRADTEIAESQATLVKLRSIPVG